MQGNAILSPRSAPQFPDRVYSGSAMSASGHKRTLVPVAASIPGSQIARPTANVKFRTTKIPIAVPTKGAVSKL